MWRAKPGGGCLALRVAAGASRRRWLSSVSQQHVRSSTLEEFMGKRLPTVGARLSAQEMMALEQDYGAHNYHPLPVVLSKGSGAYVFDTDGKRY